MNDTCDWCGREGCQWQNHGEAVREARQWAKRSEPGLDPEYQADYPWAPS